MIDKREKKQNKSTQTKYDYKLKQLGNNKFRTRLVFWYMIYLFFSHGKTDLM